MAPDNTAPKPDEGPKGEADKAQPAAGASPAEPRKGSQMTPEEKQAAIDAAKAKAAEKAAGAAAPAAAAPAAAAAAAPAAPAAAPKPAAAAKPKEEPEIREGRQVAGGLAMKKGEKVDKEAVIAKAIEKIRLTEKAIQEKPRAPEVTRRELFLNAGWLGFTAYVAFMGGCFARFFFPRVLFEPPTRFKAGYPNEYTVGEVSTKYKDTNRVWIVRESTGFYAIYARCTHLGCTPMWLEGEQKFKCPCHGSGFTKEAINYEGPAPRPMERCTVSIGDDGQIVVDTARRHKFEAGEWDRPGAYLRA